MPPDLQHSPVLEKVWMADGRRGIRRSGIYPSQAQRGRSRDAQGERLRCSGLGLQ
jgi:hypothetical protein